MKQMTIGELKDRRHELRRTIREVVTKFQEETGCKPDINVYYEEMILVSGSKVYVPVVDVVVRV